MSTVTTALAPPMSLPESLAEPDEVRTYAALGIPEVSRFDAKAGVLWFGRLQADGTYAPLTHSECLPLLTPARVLEALNLCRGVPDSRWGRLLREWINGLTA